MIDECFINSNFLKSLPNNKMGTFLAGVDQKGRTLYDVSFILISKSTYGQFPVGQKTNNSGESSTAIICIVWPVRNTF